MSDYDDGFKHGYNDALKSILYGISRQPDMSAKELGKIILEIFDGDQIRDSFFSELKKSKLQS